MVVMPKGYPLIPKGGKYEAFIEKALTSLHDMGVNDVTIAEELGVASRTVFNWRNGYRKSYIREAEYVAKRIAKMMDRISLEYYQKWNEVHEDAIDMGISQG